MIPIHKEYFLNSSPGRKSVFITGLIFTIIILLLTEVSFAQDRRPVRGFQAGNNYSLSEIETVNTRNGNLMLNIPLASLPPGRGGSGGFTWSLHYDSKIWNGRQEVFDNTTPPSGNPSFCDQFPQEGYRYTTEYLEAADEGGWYFGGYYDLMITDRITYEGETQAPDTSEYYKNFYKWKVQVRYPDGSLHSFVPTIGQGSFGNDGYFNIDINGLQRNGSSQVSSDSCGWRISYSTNQLTTSGMNYYSTDGSFTRLFIPYQVNGNPVGGVRPWMLYLPDGTIVEKFPPVPPDAPLISQRIIDRNGNKITFDINGVSDDLGRNITTRYSTNANGEQVAEIIQKGVSGEELITQIVYRINYVYRQYQAIEGGQTIPLGVDRNGYTWLETQVVDRIILPIQVGGLSYQFDYFGDRVRPTSGNYTTNGWGELKSIELPGGAKAEYGYQYPDPSFLTSFAVLENGVTRKDLTYTEEYDGATTLKTDSWYYSFGIFGGSVSAPDGTGSADRVFGGAPGALSNLSYRTDYTGRKVERLWRENQPAPNLQSGSLTTPLNPYVKTEFTSIYNNAAQPYLTAIKDYENDKNGNVIKIVEYDWVAYSSIPRQTSVNDPQGFVTGIPSGATIKRITVNSYYNQTPNAATTTITDGNVYVFGSSPRLKGVLKATEVQNGSGTPVVRNEFIYDDPNNKGNLTVTKVWDSTKGALNSPDSNGSKLTTANSITTTATYDTYGNPTSTIDAKGNQTQITYGNIVTPTGTVSGLYPTQIISAYGTAIQRTSTSEYDFSTGVVKRATDVDNNLSGETEYDALGRPLKVKTAVNTPLEIWTQSEYDDLNRRMIVRSDLFTKGDGKKIGIQHYDQLGRVRLARTIEDVATQNPYNEADGIKVQTRYLMGIPNSYQLVSNPYRAATSGATTNEQSMGWTRSLSVSTGRHAETETFSGTILPVPWGNNTSSTGKVQTDIDADRTLVTDQAGKQRISKTNALGQLTDIWEIIPADSATVAVSFPNQAITAGYQTSYQYDILNNLTKVIQGTQANRNFTYSSLSRLLSAQNPESGTITYGYDGNGNVTQKTDARSIATNYSYDALNRVLTRSYTDGVTPAVSYFYDNLPNAKGKLIKVSSSVSTTEYTSFDILGRVLSHKQTTDGNAYTTAYSYNLSGALIEETYPSTRVVKNVLDNDGDLAIVQSKKNQSSGFFNYAKNFTYTAAGAVSSMQLGNGKWESTSFNSRLQPTQISLGTVQNGTDKLKLNYDYGTTQNNGNVLSQTITVPTVGTNQGFTATQVYTYDSLNRLKSAIENIGATQTWKQTFTFDRYGNRRFDTANTTTLGGCPQAQCNPTIDTANNRFTTGQGYTFDLAGNLITDATGRSFIYDAENKQKSVSNTSGTIGTYLYDGDGKRVKKVSATEETIFVYDALGKLVAEYSNQTSQTPQVSYLTSDHLGSPRITTDANGQVISRRDFMLFGEEIYSTVTAQRNINLNYGDDGIKRKFTSYERNKDKKTANKSMNVRAKQRLCYRT